MRSPATEPNRTCVGCRLVAPKSTLVRIVAGTNGPSIDRFGGAPGRGAYVHSEPVCTEAASRGGVLGRALRARLSSDEVGRLMREIVSMGVE